MQRTLRRALVCALISGITRAGGLWAAESQPAGGEVPFAAVQQQLTEVRRRVGCPGVPQYDTVAPLEYQGRPAIGITGRERGEGLPGADRDAAVFDRTTGRIVKYVCHANVSRRQAGEPIISLAEISVSADRLANSLLPGSNLVLESIERYRESGAESVYYEARYTPAQTEFPFVDPPVRLLFNASAGSLFRLMIDPGWLEPAARLPARISQKAAERIVAVVLRGREPMGFFGPRAVLGKIAAAELFMVHPNGWLGIQSEDSTAQLRVAWVVPFYVEGGDAPGVHRLFVDAATGRVIGGIDGEGVRGR